MRNNYNALFEQVRMNLILNARHALPNGGAVTIETSNVYFDAEYALIHPGTSAGTHIMLSVTDDGQGMDETTRARVFEPFFTTKETRKGTGMGLAMV